MRITDKIGGYRARYDHDKYILETEDILPKFTEIEPISKTAMVYRDGKEIEPHRGFWATEPDVDGKCLVVDWPY